MAQKFIIIDGEIICGGSVDYHSELVGKKRDKKNVIGGGSYHWDEEKKIVYFYGSSLDFGTVSKEQFLNALPNSLLSVHWDDHKFIFSNKVKIDDVLTENNELIDNPNI